MSVVERCPLNGSSTFCHSYYILDETICLFLNSSMPWPNHPAVAKPANIVSRHAKFAYKSTKCFSDFRFCLAMLQTLVLRQVLPV